MVPNISRLLPAILLLCYASSGFAQTPTATGRQKIYGSLVGEWTGQLEYRDYQSDARVDLPTWLEVRETADGSAIQFTYTYDDGPAKTLREASTAVVDADKREFQVTSDRDKSSERYVIEDIEERPSGAIRLSLTGRGTENDKPVDVRITIAIDRNLYRFTKQTRGVGQQFLFRDGYVLTRREPLGQK
ncbi:MAG TPA: hypothetical protein VKV39_16815 [Candidatus Sulfotelmatobacter sp.]|nr:hypothetical protein [Candidatus Sulfotelmatobacter sp.]